MANKELSLIEVLTKHEAHILNLEDILQELMVALVSNGVLNKNQIAEIMQKVKESIK